VEVAEGKGEAKVLAAEAKVRAAEEKVRAAEEKERAADENVTAARGEVEDAWQNVDDADNAQDDAQANLNAATRALQICSAQEKSECRVLFEAANATLRRALRRSKRYEDAYSTAQAGLKTALDLHAGAVKVLRSLQGMVLCN